MKMKGIISLFLMLICCAAVLAQTDHNAGLVLNGDAGGQIRDEKEGSIRVRLSMEFTNTGKEPIVIFNPNSDFGKWQSKVIYSGYNRKGVKEILSEDVERSSSDELKEFANDIDREKPPQNLTYILNPGESVKFYDSIELNHNLFDDLNTENIITRSYNSYKKAVEYKISLTKYHPDPDFLEKLQKRWRKYGHLPLNTNGEFSITSEVLK